MASNAAKKQQQHVEQSSASMVVVACKIPNGLVLQLQTKVDRWEDGLGGPAKKTYNTFGGRRYVVRGPAYPVGTLPKNFSKFRPTPMIEGGYAITRGIPKDFWEQWLEQNKMAAYVQAPDGAEHGMIFAYDDLDSVVSAAREQEELLSGLEPISTDEDKDGKLTDPRMPKPVTDGLAALGTEHRNA